MTARRDTTGEYSFAAEGMAGTAAASALRRVRSLADQAPTGRMFQSIATLSEMSRRIETSLVDAHDASAAGNAAAATIASARAIVEMDRMAVLASEEEDDSEELPVYLQKQR